MDAATFKCKKCRQILFTSEKITSSCTKSICADNEKFCEGSSKNMYVWYLKDDQLEGWIEKQVNQGNWIKGKIFCPTCNIRLGSYDFVSGTQCLCGNVLPAIHIVKAKVDCEQKSEIDSIQSKIHLPNLQFPINSVGTITSYCDTTAESSGMIQVISSSCSPMFQQATLKRELKDINLIAENKDNNQNSGILIQENLCLNETETDCETFCKEQIEWNPNDDKEKQSSIRKRKKMSEIASSKQNVDNDVAETSSSDNALIIQSTLICAVCLDVFCSPFICRPCGHIFCESCLRIIAKPNPTKTCCPLCRQPIGCCEINRELSKQIRSIFPNEYKARLKESRMNTQNLPLPWTPRYHFNNIKALGKNLLTNRRENSLRQIWSTFCQSLPTVGILLFINIFSIVMFLLSYFGCSYIPLVVAHISSFLWQVIAAQIDPKTEQSHNLNIIHETVNNIFLLLIFVITFTIVACFRLRSAASHAGEN